MNPLSPVAYSPCGELRDLSGSCQTSTAGSSCHRAPAGTCLPAVDEVQLLHHLCCSRVSELQNVKPSPCRMMAHPFALTVQPAEAMDLAVEVECPPSVLRARMAGCALLSGDLFVLRPRHGRTGFRRHTNRRDHVMNPRSPVSTLN